MCILFELVLTRRTHTCINAYEGTHGELVQDQRSREVVHRAAHRD